MARVARVSRARTRGETQDYAFISTMEKSLHTRENPRQPSTNSRKLLICIRETVVRVDCEPSTNPRHPLHLRVSMIDQIRVGGDPGRQLSPAEFSLEQRAAWVMASDGAGAVATADLVEASAAPPVDGKQWSLPSPHPSGSRAWRRRPGKGLRLLCPTQLVSRTVSRRRVTVGSPLLPRYVFVGLEEGQGFYGLRGTPGLEGLVRMAGSIVRVQPEVLHGLHARQLAGEFEFTDDAACRR